MLIFAAVVKRAIKDSFLTVPEKIKKLNLTKEEVWHNKYCENIYNIKLDAELFLDYTLRNWCKILLINYLWLKKIIAREMQNKIDPL